MDTVQPKKGGKQISLEKPSKDEEIKDVISVIRKEVPIKFSNPGKRGFIDIQMFWDAFGRTPCLSFGAGEESLAHKPNEFVKIKELKKTGLIFEKIIRKFAS